MEIGIFWIYKNQVFSKKELLKNITQINGFKDSDFSHYKIWEEIQLKHKTLYLYEYEDIPRGRVVYNIKNKIFLIYCNHNILNDEKSKKLILKNFKIQARYKFIYDEHYKICSKNI